MKIGILTLPLHTNYGGILQNFAMQQVLKEMGHEVTTINYDPTVKLPNPTRWLIYMKRAFLHYVLRKETVIFPDIAQNKLWCHRTQYTARFIDRYINYINIKNVTELSPTDFDCIVVGSDQIWRTIYNRHFPGTANAFLSFAKEWNIKKIAYAASFGTDEWEYNEEDSKKCAELAQLFNAISVREKSATEICKERLGVEATHLLDPTMLLAVERYKKLFEESHTSQSNGNLMCYILDPNSTTDKIIEAVSKDKGLTPFYTNSKTEDETAPIEERVQPPVESWLRSFYDAEFIITDSFHACVFSILFNKPFIVYGNKERGLARFHSLLQIFGLQERFTNNAENIKNILGTDIQWDIVNKKLNAKRKESAEFLQKALKNTL